MQNEDGKFQSVVNEETRKPIEEVPKDDNDENGTSITETKVCNYAKGRWVADSSHPLYSAGCKYIQRNWACRLTNRTDFSYEGYRWQSRDCSMPKFDHSAFLKSGAVHHHGWAYRFQSTNTTILHSWSAGLCAREPINATDPNTLYAMHLDRRPAFIQEHINDLDVLVLNTAHHWSLRMVSMDKEIMYLNGKPLEHKSHWKIKNAKIFKVNNIVKWLLHSQIISRPKLRVFFRSTSPRHFFKGDWNTGRSCPNTVPMRRGNEVLQDESSDKILLDAVKGTKVEILDITAISDLRDEAHISHYGKKANDCLHWCLPGVPDTWNELLSAEL